MEALAPLATRISSAVLITLVQRFLFIDYVIQPGERFEILAKRLFPLFSEIPEMVPCMPNSSQPHW